MSFLYVEDEEVKITPDGMMMPEVKELYNSDKRERKAFFKKCITYIYFVYNPNGPYKYKSLESRKKMTCSRHIKSSLPNSGRLAV